MRRLNALGQHVLQQTADYQSLLLFARTGQPNATGMMGRRALHYAAQFDDLDEMTTLLNQGADLNAKDHLGQTPMFRALSSLSWAMLLRAGANIDAQDDAGFTILHLKAAEGDLLSVDWLARQRASVQTCTPNGDTPLHDAAWLGSWPTVRALLLAGADPTAKDHLGRTALAKAVQAGIVDPTLIQGLQSAERAKERGEPWPGLPAAQVWVGPDQSGASRWAAEA